MVSLKTAASERTSGGPSRSGARAARSTGADRGGGLLEAVRAAA